MDERIFIFLAKNAILLMTTNPSSLASCVVRFNSFNQSPQNWPAWRIA